MSQSVFIDDGYSVESAVPAVPPFHGEIRVKFRPAAGASRLVLARTDDLQYAARATAAIKQHLESWDAKDKDGKSVPITEENINRLHPNVFARLLDLILSYVVSDEGRADLKNS